MRIFIGGSWRTTVCHMKWISNGFKIALAPSPRCSLVTSGCLFFYPLFNVSLKPKKTDGIVFVNPTEIMAYYLIPVIVWKAVLVPTKVKYHTDDNNDSFFHRCQKELWFSKRKIIPSVMSGNFGKDCTKPTPKGVATIFDRH